MSDIDVVYVGSGSLSKYVNAGKWVLDQDRPVKIMGRGNNIKTVIDVGEILKRKVDDPKTSIESTTEEYEDKKNNKLRNVSVISFEIYGKKKD